MAYAYFPATVQVESFKNNGTVFVKAQNLDEAYTKLATLVTPKPSDFVDFFANVELPIEENTKDFLFVPESATSFMEVADLYIKVSENN